jgi:hypothetical protein
MMFSTGQETELIFTGLADERGLYKMSAKQNRRPGLLLTGEEDREDYGVSSRPDRGWGGGPPPPLSPPSEGGGAAGSCIQAAQRRASAWFSNQGFSILAKQRLLLCFSEKLKQELMRALSVRV